MNYPYKLKGLTYDYDDLTPAISRNTLEYHRNKHLETYIKNLNILLAHQEDWHSSSLEDILTNIDKLPTELQQPVINNGGGVYNHIFYFEELTKPKISFPSAALMKTIDKCFGSFEQFREDMTNKALTLFGSGWAWLVTDNKKCLSVITTPNQDSPLPMGLTPLLNIDVWEHAYYLDYQNMRAEYIKAFFDIIDWDIVENRLSALNR